MSDATHGNSPPFDTLVGIAVETNGQLVVATLRSGFINIAMSVVRIDPHTGDRTIVSQVPLEVFFSRAGGIAVEADGQLVVAYGTAGQIPPVEAVVRVDPHTGGYTIVSDITHGRGPPFITLVGIAVEAEGHLVVVSSGLQAVVRVDPHTGNRTIISR